MYLLKNAKIFDEDIVDLLIVNDKIAKIDSNIHIDLDGLQVIDLGGQIVIPALIDQHVHVTGGGGEGGMATRCPELAIEDILDAGVATIVGLLGTDSLTRSIENLVAKTKALREYGFQAYCLTGAYQYPSPTITGSVMRDIAFIDEIIGVKIALNDHRSSHISYEEMKRLAADVRMAGLIANKAGVVHIHMGIGKHGLKQVLDLIENENIPASVFRPTHMFKHMEEGRKLAELGTYVDFTTTEKYISSAKAVDEALRTYPEGRVTMSSDSNGSMPQWNDKNEIVGIKVARMTSLYGTVKSLVNDFGYSLRDALAPCTVNVAKALNIYPKVGTIQEGSLANLLILDDKLDIKDFILNGQYVKKDYNNIMKINFVN